MPLTDDKWNLFNFIQVAQDTTAETIKNLPEALEYLSQIDLLFREFISNAGNPSSPIAAVLLMNAHASFRAAIRLTISGQLPPVFMALRGAIESALYANAMVIDKNLQDIWLQRHRDEEARNRCKNSFTTKQLFKYLKTAHGSEFVDAIHDHYESTIDFGAHPNNRSLLSHIRLTELEGGAHAVELAYLHGFRSAELRQCLVACAEVGLAVMFIALICSSNHPAREELNKRTVALHKGISRLITILSLQIT